MQPKDVKLSQLKHHWEIYLFVIPTLILIALFQYYPASSGIFHSLFRWNGSDISEFVGFENYVDLFKNIEFWNSFKLAFILGFWNVVKMIPALLVAVCIHRCSSDRMQFLYRTLFVVPMVIPGLITVLIWRSFFFEATSGYLNQFLEWSGMMGLLQAGGIKIAALLLPAAEGGLTDGTLARSLAESFRWLTSFKAGTSPAWLGDPQIIIIACVIWGFPWVGSFAVLTHLAKLQNISKDVYEAADIDGANWWSRFTKIELPLLMGSIYLLLVFAIIDTIKDAGMVLALAGMTGGPGGRATVPALFMLRKAFMDQQMGYACAVGIVLTAVVLLLQKICNMLLSAEGPEDEKAKGAPLGLLALFAGALGYLYFRAFILTKTAAPLNFTIFAITALLFIGICVVAPLLIQKSAQRALWRKVGILAAGIAMPLVIWFGLPIQWLLFAYTLLVCLSMSRFKVGIGAIGIIITAFGIPLGSMDLMVAGGVFIILSIPWGIVSKRMEALLLRRAMDNEGKPEIITPAYTAIALLYGVLFCTFWRWGGTGFLAAWPLWQILLLAVAQVGALFVARLVSVSPSKFTAPIKYTLSIMIFSMAVLFAAVVGWISYEVALLAWTAINCMLWSRPFRTAFGWAGVFLGTWGWDKGSLTLTIIGGIMLVCAIPWKAVMLKLAKFKPDPKLSVGEQYSAESFALQQMPASRFMDKAKDWGLRFGKHAFIWFVLSFAFLPLYLMLIVSVKDNTQFYLAPNTVTTPLHWENWATAWQMVSPTVANSIFLSTMATCFIVLFGLAGAYFFGRLRVPGSSFLWNALLLLMMMPMIANLVPLFILLRDMNLLNTLSALILVGASGGQAFAIFVFRNFIADIPQDLFEAAEIDGANHFQQLKMVVIPLSGPIMGTVAVMQFLGQWNEFVTPLIVMREQARLPVTVQLIRMAGEYIKLWGPLMAGYAIASIPVIILFTFSMKLFIKGLTEGAVKG